MALPFPPVRRRLAGLAMWLLAIGLVLQHPLHPAWIGIALILYLVGLMRYPRGWLVVIPAALPLLDLSLWSGRFLYDEFDLLLLVTLGKLFWSTRSRGALHFTLNRPGSWLVHGLALSTLLSLALAMWPPVHFGPEAWYSFLSPWNGLRVAKGCLFAWLLWPFMRETLQQHPEEATRQLAAGLLAGLGGFGLAILWERGVLDALFNWRDPYRILGQLLDFSGRYRVTGLFSSMRVGGTAIDGYITAALPFALAAILMAPGLWARLLAGGVLALGLYALLVTFTRTTYLAGATGFLVLLATLPLLHPETWKRHAGYLAGASGHAVLVVACLATAFHWGGYEAVGEAAGLTLAAVAAGLLLSGRSRPLLLIVAAALPATLAVLLAGAFQESRYHHLPQGLLWPVAIGLALLLAPPAVLLGHLARLRGLGRQLPGAALIVVLIATGVIGISGGTRMEERFSAAGRDLITRIAHWRDGMALRQPGWLHALLGEGVGRYPALYHTAHLAGGAPEGLASYRFLSRGVTAWVRLGPGDYNLAQRIPLQPDTTYRLRLRVRTAREPAAARLGIDFCPKHILRHRYSCKGHTFALKAQPGWQTFEWRFDSGMLGAGRPWTWPVTLLLYKDSGQPLDITDLSLEDPLHRDFIANGNFAHGGDRWYFVSDFSHLAWHSKQLYIHLWLEQGWLGLSLFLLAMVLGATRQLRALRRGHAPAAPLLASLAGLSVLGLTSTFIDDSHVGLLVYLLLFASLQWPAKLKRPPRSGRARRVFAAGAIGLAVVLAWAGTWSIRHLQQLYRQGLEQADLQVLERAGVALPLAPQKGDLPFRLDLLRRAHPRILLPQLAQWHGTGQPELMRERARRYRQEGIHAPPPCTGSGLLPRVACWVAGGDPAAGIDALRLAASFRPDLPREQGHYGNAWQLALAYDLLSRHPAMSARMRSRFERVLSENLRAYLLLLNRRGSSLWHGRATLAAHAWLIAAVLDPDLPYHRPLIRSALVHFREVLHALQLTEGWPEGYNYWINSRALALSLAGAAYVNTVRDPGEQEWVRGIFSRTGRWMLYATRPDGRIQGFGDEGPRVDLKDETRPAVDIIAQFTRDPVLATYSRYLGLLHPTESYWRGYRWGFRLFNDPTLEPGCRPRAADLSCLNGQMPTAELFGRGAFNQAFIRSGWGPHATFISFRAGASFTHHGHYDAGHFTLFKNGPLAVDSSTYSGKVITPNRLYYAIRGVAKNTLLVLRPGETVHPNRFFTENIADGGPRITLPTGSAISSVADWRGNLHAGKHLDGGRILHFAHRQGDYTYIAADLTAAYDTPEFDSSGSGGKVRRITRELLYLRRQDRLIIHDRVETTGRRYLVKWLLHLSGRPTIDGLRVVSGSRNSGILEGDAREVWLKKKHGGLVAVCLQPADERVHLVGGPKYRYYVEADADESTLDGRNIDEGAVTRPWFDPAPWRVEFQPSRPEAVTDFLVALWPQRGVETGSSSLAPIVGNAQGLLSGETVIVFTGGRRGTLRFYIPDAAKRMLIAGLGRDTKWSLRIGDMPAGESRYDRDGPAELRLSGHGEAVLNLRSTGEK